jgi:hypothetical protein
VDSNQSGQVNGGFEPAVLGSNRQADYPDDLPKGRRDLGHGGQAPLQCGVLTANFALAQTLPANGFADCSGSGPQAAVHRTTQCKPADPRSRSNPLKELGLECRETQTQARSR